MYVLYATLYIYIKYISCATYRLCVCVCVQTHLCFMYEHVPYYTSGKCIVALYLQSLLHGSELMVKF